MPLHEDWAIAARLDVGGLGLSSDFTLAAGLGVQFRFAESWTLEAKYRALWVDYESGTGGAPGSFAYDTVTHGPFVGVSFGW